MSAQTERPSAGMPHLIRAAYRGHWFSSLSSRRAWNSNSCVTTPRTTPHHRCECSEEITATTSRSGLRGGPFHVWSTDRPVEREWSPV